MKEARIFLGRVTEAHGQFVPQNATDKTAFALDNQERAKKLSGMVVEVIGKLDAKSSLIHVVDIQAV